MPIIILVTFMEAGPPKVRPKYTHPPLNQEPEDKMIVLVANGGGFPSLINEQWLRENIRILPDWLFQKKLNIENNGLGVAITWAA